MKHTPVISYRAEIDGLRAVSVVLVILFHLGLDFLPGGFIGVDVFFVISGFLITSILIKDVGAQQFSFIEFYKRRAIRLGPAYTLVILVSTIAAFILLLPAELLVYLKSLIYSSFFLANFFMWDQVGGYFGSEAELMPLLHLWSLAVEEQFYLFWPITFIVLSKLLKDVRLALMLIFLTGLGFSQWATYNYPAASYFLLPTRAFELVLGALIVFAPSTLGMNAVLRNFLSLSGLVLILYGSLVLSHTRFFPGFNALYPCMGAALVLFFAKGKGNLVQIMLSYKFVVFTGRISYPLYLWHWPIISFAYIYQIEIAAFEGFAIIALSFLLSCFTYYFVEQPAKALKQYPARYAIVLFFLMPAILFSSFSLFSIHKAAWPERVAPELQLKSEAILSQAHEERGRCHQGPVILPLPPEFCVLGVPDVPLSVLLIGDSHANHFTGFIDILLKDANRRAYDITQNTTLFLPDLSIFRYIGGELREYKNFRHRNDFLVNHIDANDYDFIVMGGSFAGFFEEGVWDLKNDEKQNRLAFRQSMKDSIQLILAQDSIPVIIEGNPVPPGSLADCSLNNLRFGLNETCHFSRKDHDNNFRRWNLFLDELTSLFPDLLVIRITDLMCDENVCFSELSGLPLYHDKGHLNYMGSEFLGERYLEKHSNPFVQE